MTDVRPVAGFPCYSVFRGKSYLLNMILINLFTTFIPIMEVKVEYTSFSAKL